MSALALKILSEENTGDQKKLRLVSFPSYVWNFYLLPPSRNITENLKNELLKVKNMKTYLVH